MASLDLNPTTWQLGQMQSGLLPWGAPRSTSAAPPSSQPCPGSARPEQGRKADRGPQARGGLCSLPGPCPYLSPLILGLAARFLTLQIKKGDYLRAPTPVSHTESAGALLLGGPMEGQAQLLASEVGAVMSRCGPSPSVASV